MRRLVASFAVVASTACAFRHGGVTGDGPPGDAPALDGARDAEPGDARVPPAFAFVQVASAEDIDENGETVAFPSAQAAGDLVIVFIGWYKPGTLVSVVDSQGDLYSVAAAPATSATGMQTQAVYYSCGVRAGANSVIVTFQNANQDPDVRIAEYAGVATTACLDDAVAATGSGTAVDSGTLTTAGAGELLVAGDKVFYLTSNGDPAFTTRTTTGFGDLVEDRVANAVGGFHATATQNQTGAWVMQLAAFVGP